MKALQKFSKESLQRSRLLPVEDIVKFLDEFRCLHGETLAQESQAISIRIPKPLLNAFRTKAKIGGTAYQTQIKRLMEEWLTA